MTMLQLTQVSKRFTLHHRNNAQFQVLQVVCLALDPGQCMILSGPSGMGKSTLLKLVYANYHLSSGVIKMRQADGRMLDVGQATPRELVRMRIETVGYVSQFLRVIPRVSALDVVAEPLLEDAQHPEALQEQARETARNWLNRLRIPERLWSLPPATFSGGEQQRINIARNMIKPRPLLLLDEPTASLDRQNSETVIELIQEAKSRGAAVLGIFHDTAIGKAVATHEFVLSPVRSLA